MVPTAVGVCALEPEVGGLPLHAPLAAQLELLVEDQVKVALCPSTMLAGAADNETVGGVTVVP